MYNLNECNNLSWMIDSILCDMNRWWDVTGLIKLLLIGRSANDASRKMNESELKLLTFSLSSGKSILDDRMRLVVFYIQLLVE